MPRKKKKYHYISKALRGFNFPNVPKLERYLCHKDITSGTRRYKVSAEELYIRFGFVTVDDIVWWHWVRYKELGIEPVMNDKFKEYWDYFVDKGVITIKQ